jgi:hypothetical protein
MALKLQVWVVVVAVLAQLVVILLEQLVVQAVLAA